MMRAELYWIDCPWPGRLAVMPRPRGGDWLEDEIQGWRRAGVEVIVSLLTPEEEAELELTAEADLCRAAGIEYATFPIADRGVPESTSAFAELVSAAAGQLAAGKTVAIHCRQGIGRAALVAIGALVWSGVEPAAATQRVTAARGRPVPETADQVQWIASFAGSLPPNRHSL